VLVFNANGEVFLQLRSQSKDNHPGVWDSSCSGHVDAGEDYLIAAVRELHEEIGLQVGAGALREVDYLLACEDTGQEFIRVYRTEHEGPFVLEPSEIDDGRWWNPDELTAAVAARPGDFSPAFRLVLGRLLPA
jgi:isopentenyldiphosphate isomerase